MTTPILLVLIIIAVATLLFIFEVFSVDKTSFFILLSTMLLGLVSPEEAVSGFSNPAVIAILALMVLATSLEKNGVILMVANKIKNIATWSLWITIPIFMAIVAGISSFVSTTAVVVVFIKLINDLSERFGLERNKLLLPISFAGILGGSCTLMGTSTNLLVNNIYRQYQGEGMKFFEFSYLGVTFFLAALPVIVVLAKWLLPRTRFKKLSELYDLTKYITTLEIREDDSFAGKLVKDTLLFQNENIHMLSLRRNGDIIDSPGKYMRLHPGDQLLLQTTVEQLQAIDEHAGLIMNNKDGEGVGKQLADSQIHELLLLPNSTFIDSSMSAMNRELPESIHFLALHKREDLLKKSLLPIKTHGLRLETGDRILLAGDQGHIELFAERNQAIVLRSILSQSEYSPFRQVISVGALLLVIALATTGMFTVMESALLGVGICLLSGALDLKDAYRGINWQVIFLLAGMIPLGAAMKNTGTDTFLADQLNVVTEGLSPTLVLSAIFLFTMLMSGFVSNNATAIILAPIALATAAKLGVSEKPFLYAVMFGANFSFFTPIGYQTNAIIYGMGIYSFRHFLIIGGAVSLLILGLATYLLSGLL